LQGTSIIIGSLILLAGFLAIELGLSTAILEIVMGFVGTNLLGLETIEWLDFIAIIGLVGLMFLAGYETDIDLMKRNISKNLITGLLSFSIPFIIIFTLAKFILNFEFFSSILISLGLSTTSLALVYSVLENMNVGDYSNLVIGGAMIADVTSMGILAVLVGEFTPHMLFYASILVIILVLSPLIIGYITSKYPTAPSEMELRFILLLFVILPFIAEQLYISEAVLAYSLGVIFSKYAKDHGELEKKLKTITFGFFAPAFFFRAGLLMNLSYISVDTLKILIIFLIPAYLCKYIGTYLPIRFFVKNPEIAKLSGLVYNFRLSFGIIVAIFGLEAGIITEEIYVMLLIIVLITSLISSVILKSSAYCCKSVI